MCLIIGGAVGNLIDRVRLKFVIDFFDFHIKNWHFATFNVADSAVCVGAFLIIVRLMFTTKK
jgi:signal peptidase II